MLVPGNHIHDTVVVWYRLRARIAPASTVPRIASDDGSGTAAVNVPAIPAVKLLVVLFPLINDPDGICTPEKESEKPVGLVTDEITSDVKDGWEVVVKVRLIGDDCSPARTPTKFEPLRKFVPPPPVAELIEKLPVKVCKPRIIVVLGTVTVDPEADE